MASLKEELIKWLRDENYDVQEAPVPAGAPIEWALNVIVRMPTGLSINVVVNKPKSRIEKVVLSMPIKVSDQHKAMISSLDERERLRAVAHLQNQLFAMCPTCITVFQPQPDNPTVPDVIAVSRVLYEDDIRPSQVGDSVRLLVNVFFYVVNFLNNELPAPRPAPTMHM